MPTATADQIPVSFDAQEVVWRIEHPTGAESLRIILSRATGTARYELEEPSDDPADADARGWKYRTITLSEAKEYGFRLKTLYA